MAEDKTVITIGIMTGNSLDGIDAVMTAFGGKGDMRDIAGASLPYPAAFKQEMLALRAEIITLKSDMAQAAKLPRFRPALKEYTALVAQAVDMLFVKSGVRREDVAAIGLHGQSTGEHNPPSVAGGSQPFTTQIFDAAGLAKLTGIPVIYDFRSDDIFNGGEGAPLAPMHHKHLSLALSKRGMFPVCFINGGNTSNLTLISSGETLRKKICGYDCGAFNHYIDALAKAFYGKEFDEDGRCGAVGHINSLLLQEMYNEAAVTENGANFYDLMPPKSAGPHLYTLFERLRNYPLAEEDILRTAEYFAAYSTFLSLRFLPRELDFPRYFLTFGGGWNNPLAYRDFISLLHGRGLILPEHAEIAGSIRQRLRGEKFYVGMSDEFGISGQYMEARIFADMAYCFLTGKAFTAPEITGCRSGAVCGIMCQPGENTRKRGRGYWYSRAAKGWSPKDCQ